MSKMLRNYFGYIEKRAPDAQPQKEILRTWGLGDILNKQRRKPKGYPGALLASFSAKSLGI